MASWLYECLCEADLEKYYPCFVAVGLQRTEQLADITMKDYPKLGVQNMEDRKRLFQLIKIVQSVQEEEKVEEDVTRQSFEPGCVYLQPESARSGPRRQLKFDSFFVMNEELQDYDQAFRNVPGEYANKHKAGLLNMAGYGLPEDSQNCNNARGHTGASTCTEKEVDSRAPSDVSTLLGENEAPVIQRVTHVSGYNYGVPHSCIRANTCENEDPWTGNDKIRVCVRKRPLGVREERRGEVNVVTVEDRETVLIHEKKEAVDLKQYILQHVFYFDEVFSEALSNRDVYMRTAFPLIQHIFNGGHASCFAYGQTGAGKTYTMIGTPQNPGLYALTAKDIFRQLESSQPKRNLLVWISFYEIYCGQLYDLLNARKRLFAREDGNHIVQIVGLREIQVETVDLLLEVILKGSRERSTGATGVNSDSSRSHAIIQIQVKDTAGRMFGRMSFIDLAGSERAADARQSDKQTKFEGAEINQSLLALKECIRALDQEHSHTPFRQSKLTQVLKDSFIGNSKTCMIANISPSHVATEHTLNTLRYADRVKELKKGLKCCNPVTSRSRTIGSSSPKRVQNPSSVHQGGKNSPKKVKLGRQHPPNPSLGPSKLRKYPAVFHPMNIPLSSTPKTVNKISPLKGHSSQPWLNRMTPVKGLLKAGKFSTKRTEDLAWHAEKMKGIPVGVTASEARESCQGDSFVHHNGFLKAQKVQAVRPVQKQIVPRNRLSVGDTHHHFSGGSTPDHTNPLTEKNSDHGTNEIPLQKEREQHLRFYHQQFQHPPILQQKLKYQPLEKFLATYRPQEIRLHHDSDHQRPSYLLTEDGTQLEDLDDSDFSEDSFSYASNQSKKKKRGNIDRFRHSFFLHHKELEDVEDRNMATGETRFSEYGADAEEHNQNDRWHFAEESASQSMNKIIHNDSMKRHSDWCDVEESSTSPTSHNNNTAEKPYTYQEDLACKWKNRNDFSTEYKHNVENEWQVDSNASLSLQETLNSSVASIRDYNVAETKERTSDHHAFMEESAEEQRGSAEGHTKKENGRNEDNHCKMLNMSTGSVSGTMDPLSVSLLESERTTAWDDVLFHQSQEKYLPVEQNSRTFNIDKKWEAESRLLPERNKTVSSDNKSEFIKQMVKYDQMALQASRETENALPTQTFDNLKHFCSLNGSSPSSTHQGSVNDECLLDAPKSKPCLSYGDGEDTLFSQNHESRECLNSRQYDADTEETILRMSSPESSPNFDIKDIQTTKASQEAYMSAVSLAGGKDGRVHISNVPSSKSSSSLSSIPKVTGNLKLENCIRSKESNILQNGSHSNCKELNNLEDRVKSYSQSEETGVLNNKMINTVFMHNNFSTTEHDSESQDNKINDSTIENSPTKLTSTGSQTSITEMSSHNEKTLGRAQQLVVRAHWEQLEEMTALGIKEECLLRKMSPSDFKDYVAKVDEIMLLKSKCIQSMRAQLQLYMAYPGSIVPEERTSAS